MPGFLSDSQVQDRLAGALQITAGRAGLQQFWLDIAVDANLSAWNDINAALTGREFTPPQIAAWDAGPSFQADIALWYALTRGGATKDWDRSFIDGLDRRQELVGNPRNGIQPAQVLNGGLRVEPRDTVTGVSPIGFGKLANQNDRFTMHGDGVRRCHEDLDGRW